jgi:AcrR family transcriptional regulator
MEERAVDAERGPRGPYRKGVERRAQILASAVEVFGSEGWTGTLKQVADRVGVTPAAVLVHFGSKEGLLIEVLRAWGDAQLPETEPSTFPEYLASWRRLMRYHTRNRGLLKLYLRLATEATTDSHPAHAFVVERNRRTLDGVLTRLHAAVEAGEIVRLGDEEVLAEARNLLAAVEGLEMQWVLDDRVDLVGLVSRYLDQVLERLRPPDPPPPGEAGRAAGPAVVEP